jgi:hypothetical protein
MPFFLTINRDSLPVSKLAGYFTPPTVANTQTIKGCRNIHRSRRSGDPWKKLRDILI